MEILLPVDECGEVANGRIDDDDKGVGRSGEF